MSQNALARVKTRVSETAGELMRGVRPIDLSADEAWFVNELQLAIDEVPWSRALTPNVVEHRFVAATKRQEEALDDYVYETILSRMARTYPESILRTVASIRDERGQPRFGPTATATELLNWLLEQWESTYGWFRVARPIPALYLRTPTGLIQLSTQAISIEQSSTNSRSMLDMLSEFLAIFVGYSFRTDEEGALEIIPPWWASTRQPLLISPVDMYDWQQPLIDTNGIINSVTIRSRGVLQVGQEVQANIQRHFATTYWGSQPSGWPPTISGSTLVGQNILTYQFPLSDVGINLLASPRATVTGVIQLWSRPNINSGSITYRGDARFTLNVTTTARGVQLEIRYGAGLFGLARVIVRPYIEGELIPTNNPDQYNLRITVVLPSSFSAWWHTAYFGYITQLWLIEARVFEPSQIEQAGTFTDGSSVQQYGLRRLELSNSVFAIDAQTCQLVAQSVVKSRSQPLIKRAFSQSAWRAYPITGRDLQRLIYVTEPTGEQTAYYVESVDYSEEYNYNTADIRSSVTLVKVPEIDAESLQFAYAVFTTPGTYTWDRQAAGNPAAYDVLIVGGGGGGGGGWTSNRPGGGGGAGGARIRYNAHTVESGPLVQVVVGAGGAGGVNGGNGGNGQPSSFGSLTAPGGGGGGGGNTNIANGAGQPGGSGGGGAGGIDENPGGSGQSPFGRPGGRGGGASQAGAGGGGSWGHAGGSASQTFSSPGGSGGAPWPLLDEHGSWVPPGFAFTTFGEGGEGGRNRSFFTGTAGGRGGLNPERHPLHGTDGIFASGGGGGAGSVSGNIGNGGRGGDGFVIIRWRL